MSEYIIKLGTHTDGVGGYLHFYLADFEGDPGRTFLQLYAKTFKKKVEAENKLAIVREKYGRKLKDAEILALEV